jgi:hypothetical protein
MCEAGSTLGIKEKDGVQNVKEVGGNDQAVGKENVEKEEEMVKISEVYRKSIKGGERGTGGILENTRREGR